MSDDPQLSYDRWIEESKVLFWSVPYRQLCQVLIVSLYGTSICLYFWTRGKGLYPTGDIKVLFQSVPHRHLSPAFNTALHSLEIRDYVILMRIFHWLNRLVVSRNLWLILLSAICLFLNFVKHTLNFFSNISRILNLCLFYRYFTIYKNRKCQVLMKISCQFYP